MFATTLANKVCVAPDAVMRQLDESTIFLVKSFNCMKPFGAGLIFFRK